MRMRERGIGNLPFIAVLVLFVLAIVMWFVTKSDVDSLKADNVKYQQQAAAANGKVIQFQDAYNAWVDLFGVDEANLRATSEDDIRTPDEIKKAVRAYLKKIVDDVTKAGTTTLSTKVYQVQQGTGVIVDTEGEKATIKLYGTALAADTATVRGLLDPLANQFRYAAKVMTENNEKFTEEAERAKTTRTSLTQTNQQIQSSYQTDVAQKQAQAEQALNNASELRSNLEGMTGKLDNMETELSTVKAEADKVKRDLERELQAWKDRAINEKTQKELALAEDPMDGQVLTASRTMGTVWINLGTRNQLSRGTKFTVWRPGKGNVREDVAVIRVIGVKLTSSECRIIKVLNRRVPVTAGMNVSNPFFDPKRPLRVYIFGNLQRYTTDIAAKRLTASGAIVAPTLDDKVNVIVLGEPPITGDEEMPEDETEAAAAEKRRMMDRAKRLDWILRKAVSIQALVVTENTLATFIDY